MSKQLLVPIGMPVQFFPGANRDSQPWAGIVVDSRVDGQVKLRLVDQGLRTEFVQHIDSAWVAENRLKLNAKRHGIPLGAWDFLPGVMIDMSLITVEKVTELPVTGQRRDDVLRKPPMPFQGRDPRVADNDGDEKPSGPALEPIEDDPELSELVASLKK